MEVVFAGVGIYIQLVGSFWCLFGWLTCNPSGALTDFCVAVLWARRAAMMVLVVKIESLVCEGEQPAGVAGYFASHFKVKD